MIIRITRNPAKSLFRYILEFEDGSILQSNSISGLLKKLKLELETVDEIEGL